MKEERQFKGVWIPKEVWLDKRLNALEKVILVEIDSLDDEETGCYASNKYLAEFCQCSGSKVSTGVSKLIKLGYIYLKSFDGRQRVLKSSLLNFKRQTMKIYKADDENLKDNNIDNNKDNNKVSKGRAFTPPTFEEVEEYAISRGYQNLAKKFFEYYTTGDWRDSKGNKIKNWKQKFITWEGERTQAKKPEPKNSTMRAYSKTELQGLFQNVDEMQI